VTAEANSVGFMAATAPGYFGAPAGRSPSALAAVACRSPPRLAAASARRRHSGPWPPPPDAVTDALRPVQDPELHRSIVDLEMVRDVRVDGAEVAVTVALTTPGNPLRGELEQRVLDALAAVDGVERATVDFTAMTDEELAVLRQRLHGNPPPPPAPTQAHGHAEGRAIPFADPSSDPGAAHRLGQGRRGQVVGHHQPGRRPRRSGAVRWPSSTPTCGASRSRACSASTGRPR
jgi:metal-sulfur cluster biosynthetic enzyme